MPQHRLQISAESLPSSQTMHLATVDWLLGGAFFLCPASKWLLIPGTLSWSDAFFLAAALVHLTYAVLRGGSLRLPQFALLSAALLAIACLGSYINNSNPLNLINCLKFVASLLVVPVITMWCTGGRQKTVDRMLWFWLAGACLSALIGVLTKYGIPVFDLSDPYAVAIRRVSGLTYHPNVLAYSCALLIPVATYLAVTTSTLTQRWICIVAIVLLADAILVSGSRGSVLAVMIGMMVWLPNPYKKWIHRRELFVLVTGLISIIAIVFFLLLSDKPFADSSNALSRLFGSVSNIQQSNDARRAASQFAYNGFSAAPIFGQGFDRILFAHNSGLQVLYSGGLVSFAGALIWWGGLGIFWWRLRQLASRYGTHQEVMLLQMFQSIALVAIVNGAVEPILTNRNGYIAFGLMLGLRYSPRLTQVIRNSYFSDGWMNRSKECPQESVVAMANSVAGSVQNSRSI